MGKGVPTDFSSNLPSSHLRSICPPLYCPTHCPLLQTLQRLRTVTLSSRPTPPPCQLWDGASDCTSENVT